MDEPYFRKDYDMGLDDYGSGTEEEIEIMPESGKQVFVGFSEIPINPASLSSPEITTVDRFTTQQKRLKSPCFKGFLGE